MSRYQTKEDRKEYLEWRQGKPKSDPIRRAADLRKKGYKVWVKKLKRELDDYGFIYIPVYIHTIPDYKDKTRLLISVIFSSFDDCVGGIWFNYSAETEKAVCRFINGIKGEIDIGEVILKLKERFAEQFLECDSDFPTHFANKLYPEIR